MKKWQKISLFGFSGIILLVLGFLIHMVFFFEMFPAHKELLSTIVVPDKDYKINAYYVNSGATSSGTIQLHKVYTSGKSEILKNVSGYADLKSMKILPEKTLRVIVGGKGKFGMKDTVFVQIE